MFSFNRNKAQNRIDTLIGAETQVDGNIQFSGGIRVDGTIRGNVSEKSATPSTLILSEHGRIEGEVTVSQAVINGKVTGPVRANHYIELQAKSRVIGDVCYKSLEMHTGAVVEGKLIYQGEAVADAMTDPLPGDKG